MDTDKPSALEHPLTLDDLMKKLVSDVQNLFEQQQQLQSQFAIFQLQQQQLLDQ